MLLPASGIAKLVRGKVKHVFVLVQENHTFDQLYGLFPGVNGQYVENLGRISLKRRTANTIPDFRLSAPVLDLGKSKQPELRSRCSRHQRRQQRPLRSRGIDRPGQDGRFPRRRRGRSAGTRADAEPSADRAAQRVDRYRGRVRLRHGPVPLVLREKLHALRSLLPSEHGRLDAEQHSVVRGQIGQTEAAAGEGALSQPLPSGAVTPTAYRSPTTTTRRHPS